MSLKFQGQPLKAEDILSGSTDVFTVSVHCYYKRYPLMAASQRFRFAPGCIRIDIIISHKDQGHVMLSIMQAFNLFSSVTRESKVKK